MTQITPFSTHSSLPLPDVFTSSLVGIFDAAKPAIVQVRTEGRGGGTGILINEDGRLLTNNHVVGRDDAKVEALLADGRSFPAVVLQRNPRLDLALLKIEGDNLKTLSLGDSTKLRVGEWVFAIGHPWGQRWVVTAGIMSAMRTAKLADDLTTHYIQSDVGLAPGNSGGPLLNSHGEVIGINTMIASSVGQNAGIGFAIPINTAKAVLNDLLTLGRVRRPVLGVVTLAIGPDIADQLGLPADYGLLVQRVLPGGAAERAGLQGGTERAYMGNSPIMVGGDLIVAIDGQDVQDQQQLAQIMNNHRAGDTVRVTVYRGKRRIDLNLTLGEAREQV